MKLVVTITPAEATICQEPEQKAYTPWKTQQFTAVVEGDPVNLGVTWSVAQGAGVISAAGVFEPPREMWPYQRGKTVVEAVSLLDKVSKGTAVVNY